MKAISKMLAVALGSISTALPAHAIPDRSEVIQLAASLVKVQAFDENNKTFFGTGVAIAPNKVVTSCHVTRHSAQIVVVHRNGTHHVSGQAADIDHDLCVLDVPGLAAPALQIGASQDLRVGQPVWAMGFEGGAGLQFRTGFVRALHKFDGAWVIESTTAFTSGSSGGALMDDHGQLVGLLTYRLRGDRRSYFSIPMDWLSRKAAGPQSLPAVLPVREGVAFWQRGAEDLPYFLRAHRLVIESNWPALVDLTDAWLLMDATNAEAWWYRGAGLEMLVRGDAAADAYKQALVMEPGFIPALLSLGRLFVELGDMKAAQRILALLSAIDIELGTCLSHRITHEAQAPPGETLNEACFSL
ncbi:MAG: trypsin-like peptidase domain-containing protein [Burkholderiales bacterium]